MSLQVEIGLLKKQLDKINDLHLLNAIKEMIKFANQKQEENVLLPFTQQQLISRAKQSEKNIEQGQFESISSVRKKIKNW